MTDVFVEMKDGRVVHYYIDDGSNEIAVVTPKSSIFTRKMRNVEKVVKKAVNFLEKI